MEDQILYCRCAYAQILPQGVKDGVLRKLCDSGRSFESVSDLCELAAHRDPRLAEIASGAAESRLKIAACFPRAVHGLFKQAECPLPSSATVVNMRELSADDAAAALLNGS